MKMLIATASLLMAAQVLPQNSSPGPLPQSVQQGNPAFGRLSEVLNLTEQQKPEVQAILQEMEESIRQAKTNADAKLLWVLYPAQYDKYQSLLFRQERQRFEQSQGTTVYGLRSSKVSATGRP